MNSKFRLNDRQNSNQLSDRIIDSAEEIFQNILSHYSVQQILMKGEMTDANKAIAYRRLKNIQEYMDDQVGFAQLFRNLKNLTEDPKERQFFDACIEGLNCKVNEYTIRLEQLLGKPNEKLDTTPTPQALYGMHVLNMYTTEKGPFLRGLVPILASMMMCPRVMAYLDQNPNYVDNDLTKLFLIKDLNLMGVVNEFRQMIDRRGDQVSDKEMDELSELFRRDLAFERLLQIQECEGLEWFDA